MFRKDLEALINKHSLENGSNTPDFILAQFLSGCLEVFDDTVNRREAFYGRDQAAQQRNADRQRNECKHKRRDVREVCADCLEVVE